MPSLRSVAAWTALAGLVAATPIEQRGNGFSLDRVHMGYRLKNGAREMAKTFTKYGGTLPADTARAAAGNGTGSGSVVTQPGDQYDSLYLTPVNVGGTTMMLDFDTGSADLWVFSSELPASESSGHAVYKVDPSKKKQGYSWKIQYGDGSGASGDVYSDTVTVGGVAVSGQAVEAAKQISQQFSQDKDNDGLLGLAFSSINTVSPQQQTTWFDTAVKAGDLGQNVFAAKLEHQAPGKYDFGFIDTASYTGEVAYADVDSSQGFWEFNTDGYAVGSKTSNQGFDAIADTGTTLIYAPDSVVRAYYSQVSGAKQNSQAGGYTVPCNAQLPDFSLIIGGQKRTTAGANINYAPVSGNDCFGGIQSNAGLQGLSIIGDVFLKSQYVVFDASAPRVGFAAQKA